jgi:hypothetical protein
MQARVLVGKIGTRHARPDKRMLPVALRPNEVFSLSMIAGMAHSTLKAKAATQNGVAFRYQLKVRVKRPPGRGTDCPVFVKIRQRTWPISFAIRCDWINGQDLNDGGRHARTRQNKDLRNLQ